MWATSTGSAGRSARAPSATSTSVSVRILVCKQKMTGAAAADTFDRHEHLDGRGGRDQARVHQDPAPAAAHRVQVLQDDAGRR